MAEYHLAVAAQSEFSIDFYTEWTVEVISRLSTAVESLELDVNFNPDMPVHCKSANDSTSTKVKNMQPMKSFRKSCRIRRINARHQGEP